jgi:23S rRNA (adenine2503-C2)-methyltransferase
MTVKKDIRKYGIEEIMTFVTACEEPQYKAKQVYEWLWKKSVTDFDKMTNLSKDFRSKLKEFFEINSIQEDARQESSDGTIKTRFRLHDDNFIESVLIPVPKDNRFTVCVSSQVGCSLSCKFCATGQMKRMRNLDAGEIYDQVVAVNRQCMEVFNHSITNIVYMGMGEPLLNYKNVLKSIHYLCSHEGLGMSPRRITVSTAGIAKMIRKLGDDKVRFNLALSLHAADDKKRDKIMPINEQNNLETLESAIQYFYQQTKGRISYEYIALAGLNDSIEDAKNLIKYCQKYPVQVNIIEYNTVSGLQFKKSSDDSIDKFARFLRNNRVMVTVRRSRGKDIDAACGQLANK